MTVVRQTVTHLRTFVVAVIAGDNNCSALMYRGVGPFTSAKLAYLLVFHITALGKALRSAFVSHVCHPKASAQEKETLEILRRPLMGDGELNVTESGSQANITFTSSTGTEILWTQAREQLTRYLNRCTKERCGPDKMSVGTFRAVHKTCLRHLLIIISLSSGCVDSCCVA